MEPSVPAEFYVAMNGTVTAVCLGRLYSVADAVDVNGWQAEEAYKGQAKREGGLPYKPGPNHPWKKFVVNYRYKRRELGKKGGFRRSGGEQIADQQQLALTLNKVSGKTNPQ